MFCKDPKEGFPDSTQTGKGHKRWTGKIALGLYLGNALNFDAHVKNLRGRHSRERGRPQVVYFPGFPRLRE